MFGFFSWIRQQTCNAVLAGLEDAAAKLDSGTDDAVAKLLARLTPALPEPPSEPPTNGRGRRRVEA